MEVVRQAFYFVLVLGVLITFHEFGHFWVARRCGVRVLRFSIGFGPALVRWHDRQGAEFVVAALPLGGYVKMLDEREGEIAEHERDQAFNRKSAGQRIAIVAAGPLANFALAIAAYWLVFVIGVQGIAPVVAAVKPGSVAAVAGLATGDEILAVDGAETPTVQALSEMLVRRLGDSGDIHFRVAARGGDARELTGRLARWDLDPTAPEPIGGVGIELYRPPTPPVVATVEPGSPADQAGIRVGDRIVATDGAEIDDWFQWVERVRAHPEQPIAVVVDREGGRRTFQLTPRRVVAGSEVFGQAGVTATGVDWPVEYRREQRYGPVAALAKGVATTWDRAATILDSVRKILVGDISVRHLSGPITIAKVAGASAQYGLVPLLQFVALLSVSFGVLNLLPIPVLDGGHLAYYALEAIRGRPLSERIQEAGYRIGLSLVIGLMLLALYNDFSRF